MKFLILVIIIIFMTVECRRSKNSIEEVEEHDQKQHWHRIHQDRHQNHWDDQHQYQQDQKNLEHSDEESESSEDLSQEYEDFFEDLEIDSAGTESQEETSDEQNLEVAKEIVENLENLAYDELSAEFPILLIPGVQGVVLGMVNLLIVDNVLPEIVREGKDFFDILRNVRNTIYGIDMDEENAEKMSLLFRKPKEHIMKLMRECTITMSPMRKAKVAEWRIRDRCMEIVSEQHEKELGSLEVIRGNKERFDEVCSKFDMFNEHRFIQGLQFMCTREANFRFSHSKRKYRESFEHLIDIEYV